MKSKLSQLFINKIVVSSKKNGPCLFWKEIYIFGMWRTIEENRMYFWLLLSSVIFEFPQNERHWRDIFLSNPVIFFSKLYFLTNQWKNYMLIHLLILSYLASSKDPFVSFHPLHPIYCQYSSSPWKMPLFFPPNNYISSTLGANTWTWKNPGLIWLPKKLLTRQNNGTMKWPMI